MTLDKILWVTQTRTSRHEFSRGQIIVGSGEAADCIVRGSCIEAEHAVVFFEGGELKIKPLEKGNTIFLKDGTHICEVTKPTPILSGAQIMLGQVTNTALAFDLL